MRSIVGFVFFIGLLSCSNQEKNDTQSPEILLEHTEALAFDSLKAAKYGADDYGMKSYVIAFLKRGPNRDIDSTEAYTLQRAHLDNIGKMAEAGKLVLAGPFFGNDDLRGIYIFDVKTVEEAEILTKSDPAIKAGSLIMELKQWYGSAALLEVGEIHSSIAKEEI